MIGRAISGLLSGNSSARLEPLLDGRDNHLNLIRMGAASAVLVSHAYPITQGPGAIEPLVKATGQSLGHFAVAIFFGLSGLLIARSFDRRHNMIQFGMARIMRLYPALIMVLTLTVLAGAWLTLLPPAVYLKQAQTWTYVPSNLSLALLQYPLPGVFAQNPFGPEINGSLWTLFYEVACYGAVVGLGLIGLIRRPILFSAFFALVAIAHLVSLIAEPTGGLAYRLDRLALLGFPFALGMLAYVWRARLVLSLWLALALWLPPILLLGTAWAPPAIMVALVYSTFYLGLVPKGPLLAYNKLGDFSYGTYIYAFPVQQAFVWLIPGQSPVANIALSWPLTLVFGIASWHLVEKRSLRLARPLAERFTRLSGSWRRQTAAG